MDSLDLKSLFAGSAPPTLTTYRIGEQPKQLPALPPLKPGLSARLRAEAAPWKLKPYQHQLDGLGLLFDHPTFGLFWEMGCGKTAPVCVRLRVGYDAGEFTGPTLILCPLSVVDVWRSELEKHADLPCVDLTGTKRERDAAIERVKRSPSSVAVANYEWLLTEHGRAAEKISWAVIVCDEAHRVRNTTTQTFRAVRRVSERAIYRWALTGTPAPNGPHSLFGVGLFLRRDRAFGTISKTAFEGRYCIKGGFEGRQIVGWRNLDELARNVNGFAQRLRKADCLDLPPKVYERRTCKLSPEARRVYDDIRKEQVAELAVGGVLSVTNILTAALRLVQITGGFVPDDDGRGHAIEPNAKLALLADVLEEIEMPVVIWCCFKREIEAVRVMLADRRVVVYTGDTPADERAQAVADFQSGKADVFLGTPQAGGLGITLTAAATEIFYGRTYNFADMLQAEDRLHRVGQQRSVTVIDLVAEDTLDAKILGALERKAAGQEIIMRTVDDAI